MNYGIGKMRPCGHSHINKYAHAAVYQDVERINREFYYDLTSEGEWIYPFEKLSNWRDLDSSYASWFHAEERLKKWHIPLPETLGWASHMFTGCYNLVDLDILFKSKSTNANFFILGHGGRGRTTPPTKFHFKLPYCGGTLTFTLGTCCPPGSEYKVYAPKIHTLVGSLGNTPLFSQLNGESSLDVYAPNVQDLKFGYMYLTEVTYNVDEDGNPSFWTGKETVGTEYNVFPKLKKGTDAFLYGQLNADYTKAFLEALPSYTDSKVNHPLTIGIHIDNCYDEEVNRLLKLTDNEWVELREVNVTEDKGWKLDVRWNGTPTDKETLFGSNEPTRPSFIEKDIELPDGYTRCEYLEDNGTQWIDTGYVPKVIANSDGTYTATTGLYAIAKQITHAGDVRFFGSGYESNNNGFTAPRWLKSTGNSCGFAWKTWTSWGNIGNGSAFESELNFLQSGTANLVTNYGNSYSNTLNANLGFTPSLPLYLFSTNVNNTSPTNRRWCGRIYRAKISEGTEIVRDFVPCLDANNVPCMYDVLGTGTVEENTYYNANPDSTFLYKLLES